MPKGKSLKVSQKNLKDKGKQPKLVFSPLLSSPSSLLFQDMMKNEKDKSDNSKFFLSSSHSKFQKGKKKKKSRKHSATTFI